MRSGSSTQPGYLLVIPWDLEATGGVSQVVQNLYRELPGDGWSPSVLISTWDEPTPRYDDDGEIPVLRWRVRSPWNPGNLSRGLAAFLVTLPGVAWTWRRLARRHQWGVVNAHYPGVGALTWIVLKRLRCWRGLLFLSVHGREVRDAMNLGGWVQRRLMRLLLEQSDAVIACADELARDVGRLAPAARISVIPNAVSAERLRQECEQGFRVPATLESRDFILNVATFEHKKSQDVLIDAFARLASRHPDVDLVMAGRPTAWLDELRKLTSASGVADRVHFFFDLPHHQISTLLSRARVFCLPSRSEGHPLAILEAAVLGVPVVATPVGGIPETIPDETHGLLVPVGDAQALSEALGRLLGDPEHAQALGRKLQRHVEREFTWARAAERYTELARRGGEVAGN